MLWRHAVPAPELQFEMRTRDGRLLGYNDFGWPSFCHLGEFDGKRKYTRDIQPDEDPGEVVFREKRREDEMRREGAGMSRRSTATACHRAADRGGHARLGTAVRSQPHDHRVRPTYSAWLVVTSHGLDAVQSARIPRERGIATA
jgi:hypothetical protein